MSASWKWGGTADISPPCRGFFIVNYERDQMDKKYNHREFEDRIYSKWIDSKAFSASVNRDKKPFTIVMPPPNITGKLHEGHALNLTLQDILIRFKRMQGFEALWIHQGRTYKRTIS